MSFKPHNHRMWAVIGIYCGREDNIFWRRIRGRGGRIEAAGAQALGDRRRRAARRDIIHSVTNPIRASPARSTSTAAISSASAQRMAIRETLPRTLGVEKALRMFEDANKRVAGA